jgi:hypothetical protein
MDNLLLNKLENNLKNTNDDILNNIVIQEYIQNINNSIKELNELLEDIKNNNIINLQNKYKESMIEKKTMQPFIKYLMVYNTFVRNLHD